MSRKIRRIQDADPSGTAAPRHKNTPFPEKKEDRLTSLSPLAMRDRKSPSKFLFSPGYALLLKGFGFSEGKSEGFKRAMELFLASACKKKRGLGSSPPEPIAEFCKELFSLLKQMHRSEQLFFYTYYDLLVMISSISAAFASKSLEGQSLKVLGREIGLEEIESEEHRGYFLHLCRIKEEIQKIEASLGGYAEWGSLLELLDKLQKEKKKKRLCSWEACGMEAFSSLFDEAYKLAESLSAKDSFQRALARQVRPPG